MMHTFAFNIALRVGYLVLARVRIAIEEQSRLLSTFATRSDISENDEAILLKAEYYLLRLSLVSYVDWINSTIYRLRESQKRIS